MRTLNLGKNLGILIKRKECMFFCILGALSLKLFGESYTMLLAQDIENIKEKTY